MQPAAAGPRADEVPRARAGRDGLAGRACCPPSTARPSPTPRATSSAASRSSSSPSAPRTCSRASTPRAPAPASTSTRCASRSASSPASRPFNFPAMIPLWKAGPALAAGNAFILKPSERDPSVPLRLAELFLEAGLPAGVFNVVNGDKEAVDALLTTTAGQGRRLRRLHPDRAVHLRDRRGQRQARAVLRRRQEPRDRHARRRSRRGRRRPDRRRLRLGGRALHGDLGRRPGRRGDRRRAGRQADRARRASSRSAAADDEGVDFGPLVGQDALERVKNYIQIGVDEGATLVVDGRGFTARGPRGRLLRRRHPVRQRHHGHARSTRRRSSARSCIVRPRRTTTKRRCACRPSTSTATASRSSPATATPPATSPPASRSAWSASTCRSRCRSRTTPSAAGSAPASATSTSTAPTRSASTPRPRP